MRHLLLLAALLAAGAAPALAMGQKPAKPPAEAFEAPATRALVDHALKRWKEKPGFAAPDAYNWLYHAVYGAHRPDPDVPALATALAEEWGALTSPPLNELVAEPLDPAGQMLQINLRAYKLGGGLQPGLLDSFVKTARLPRPETQAFAAAWRALGDRLAIDRFEGIPALTHRGWRDVDAQAGPRYLSPVRHSDTYRDESKPAYRIVAGRFWPPAKPR